MGVCQSKTNQSVITKQIDRELADDADRKTLVVKLLLLGTADSGKSTILKQMRIVHHDGFSDSEARSARNIVYMNIIESMVTLLDQASRLGLNYTHYNSAKHASQVRAVVSENRERDGLDESLKCCLEDLWSDPAIQECFERRSGFQIIESAKYFLDDLARIAEPNYVPDQQDMLRLRVPTNGVVEVGFDVGPIKIQVVDVGGQRSERRKWIHCFDDVDAIIFVTAASEYDQTLQEDGRTNRIAESLELFAHIVNSNLFGRHVSFILFINKIDLFAEKIKRAGIKVAFPEYRGTQDYQKSLEFIKEKYLSCARSDRKIYSHNTCATDTNQVKLVIESVIDTIRQINMAKTNLI